ncbi:hypothetical protein B0H65DRAFT_468701 [Neurospora tetraspora]|uniref:Uncharacterized protein n=1 Tax=Neurospora tetraspora TaxID=94610 RepID=A0AAE0MR17_9PEZI|nr:hypothetical protein B0H65DRAFT_468701 [Neurospora tetraspora]
MASNTTEKAGPGQIHARIVDDAEKTMRQFNTPVVSADLLNKLVDTQLKSATAPVEWSTYHQMTSVQRLQLETLFDTIHGLDEDSCAGWQVPSPNYWGNRPVLLRSVLLSIASLIFVRTSTTITMGTYGAVDLGHDSGEERSQATQLVEKEGIASLKADCELILKLVTTLADVPSPKKAQ